MNRPPLLDSMAFTEPVVITEGPKTDVYGDPVSPTGTPREALALVWPRESTEPIHQNRDGVIVGLAMCVPPETVIHYDDQVFVRGALYDIEGEPGLFSGLGWTFGWQVALRRAQG